MIPMLTIAAARPRAARRLLGASLAGLLVAGGIACAERGASDERDSSGSAGAAGGARLVRPTDDPEAAFRAQRGRTWELARLGTQEIAPAPARSASPRPGRHPGPGNRPTIRFTTDPAEDSPPDSAWSNAGGWSFCNGYGAAYTVGPGDRLRFHRWQSTLVGCDGPDAVESRFFRALGASRRFALDADTLALIADDGSRLTFVAVPDSAR